ncbi:hypothetical protein PFICI_14151 [Pestalotiopsis fici W106-1]|uniref:Uncharacterized protein n=1 Tax=Pestalotiopsis fici (strain W106-1 / CGMCC3.15140) TaxID=1229662 RepID=W3WK49_PESFW|nr:uncharacterized protein PFICI_14151 [Pestalotiopsis fici W106-1]ETS74285.1 hypothetical protein PFICI_14151 [Pestalotiopsis fici W106-1]
MDRYRSPVALEALQTAPKPEGKKLRRKLQKIPNNNNNNKRNSVSYANSITSNAKTSESRGFRWSAFTKRNDSTKGTSQAANGSSPLPIDLSDPKWNDYLRTSRYVAKDVEFVPQPHIQEKQHSTTPVTNIVPEFAHLNVTNELPRNLSETASTDGLYSPDSHSSAASASTSRRKAKTPVTRIGQLEESAAATRDPASMQDATSIEHIAESYRALVETPSDVEERFMTPFQEFQELPSDLGTRAWEVPADGPVKTVISLSQSYKQDTGSPTASDGTLVGFEEDAIYFKPVSLLTDPPSPRNQVAEVITVSPSHGQSVASLLPENPTVQIISDLLTKELSTAFGSNAMRPSGETSSLQVWLMIEAYEKLKEKVDNMGLGAEHTQSVQSMFGMWLQTLHTIHDNLTGDDGRHSESDYGE